MRNIGRRVLGGVMLAAMIAGGAPLAAQTSPSAIVPASGTPSCLPPSFYAAARYQSVEVRPDGRVTFRLCAPEAREARVTSSDLPGIVPAGNPPGSPVGLAMAKDAAGLWSVTTDAVVAPDTYRFNFRVDGARVPDPRGTHFSEERTGTNSVFEVPGAAGAFQTFRRDVPHGAVATIHYWSKAIGGERRAHVYTPPGYDKGRGSYPVLYLVHGAGDSDDSWTSVGHANFILDNLIASGRAKPMIIVMPFGHTPDRPQPDLLVNTDFGNDLIGDLIPLVDSSYRTIATADSRAMAGLSMGGAHTIRFGLTHPELFHWTGVFSMGLGVNGDLKQVTDYETANAAALDRDAREMRLVYYAIGKDDFLYATSAPTRALLARHKVKVTYNESAGGHTWINWRRYLEDFAPKLFR